MNKIENSQELMGVFDEYAHFFIEEFIKLKSESTIIKRSKMYYFINDFLIKENYKLSSCQIYRLIDLCSVYNLED